MGERKEKKNGGRKREMEIKSVTYGRRDRSAPLLAGIWLLYMFITSLRQFVPSELTLALSFTTTATTFSFPSQWPVLLCTHAPSSPSLPSLSLFPLEACLYPTTLVQSVPSAKGKPELSAWTDHLERGAKLNCKHKSFSVRRAVREQAEVKRSTSHRPCERSFSHLCASPALEKERVAWKNKMPKWPQSRIN